MNPGILYVVATPIGNLGDMTPRAVDTLHKVACIAAEDTRHSSSLLHHFHIRTPLLALHQHNEREAGSKLIARLQGGEDIALISDAGTPLISDPGFSLVQGARAAGLRVVPVPGCSAVVAALSVAGLPTDRFVFEGFLPAKPAARRQMLEAVREEPRTLVFYEAPHRLLACLQDMQTVFGDMRQGVLVRELTKIHETVYPGNLQELVSFVASDCNQQRGEIVILLQGAPPRDHEALSAETCRIAGLLAEELPVRQAAGLAARITGTRKNRIYDYLLKQSCGTDL